jgi:hypothetical protein
VNCHYWNCGAAGLSICGEESAIEVLKESVVSCAMRLAHVGGRFVWQAHAGTQIPETLYRVRDITEKATPVVWQLGRKWA